ncbi:MAG: NAD(P)H-hydrate dehydratase [Acidobacteria bacterium]|nr:NAD(P)H-hydrate dehydratase [Acidobacteriota bacterium]
MREVDRLTIERHGISGLQLMENAGRHVADYIRSVCAQDGLERTRRVAVLCGKGNNGGDGFVVARQLLGDQLTFEIKVYLFGAPQDLRGDAAENYKSWREAFGVTHIVHSEENLCEHLPKIENAHVIVDAIFGTGLRGPVTGPAAKVIEALNQRSANATSPRPGLIIAVDTPSGLFSDGESATGPVLHAHKTITFTAPKIGQLISRDAPCCGELIVKQIGSPLSFIEDAGKGSLRWAGADEFASLPLIRTADSHKGNFGHVLVVGGSIGKSGAAVLSGFASLCSGAGLTTVACPDVVHGTIASAHPEYMTEPLPSTGEGTIADFAARPALLKKLHEGKTAVAIGPGLGTHPETQRAIRQLVRETAVPVILDADGLNAFAGDLHQLRERESEFLAITPHPGEMARLLGVTSGEIQSDRLRIATEAAKRANAHVLLKGFHTVLAAPDGRVFVNTTGGPELAKGGSGDVLTGVLAALTAQFGTRDWLRVLALGAYLHGSAATQMSDWQDPSGQLASAVASVIPLARHKLLEEIGFLA